MAPRSNASRDAGPRRIPSLARRALWLAGGLLVLAGAAWAAVAVLLPPERVRALVRNQLAATLARDVRYADASAGFWPPVRITVASPELAEPEGFQRGAAFQARSVHLDLDVFALLGRRVVVRRLVIDEPALHLVIRRDGSTNLDRLFRAPREGRAPAKPMDLDVRELTVRNGRVLLDDLGKERRTVARVGTRVALRATAAGTTTTSGETRIAGLKWGPLAAAREADLGGGLEKVEWTIEHRGGWREETKRLGLERLAVRFGGTDLVVSGTIDDPGPRARLDLKTRGRKVELRDVLAHFAAADLGALQASGSGVLDFDLGVRGAFGPDRLPTITGALTLANGQLRYEGAPASVRDLRLAVRFAPDSITIHRLEARVGGGDGGGTLAPVTGWFQATRLRDPLVRFDLRGSADLAAISPLVAPKDTRLGGRAGFQVRGQGRAKDPGSVALAGQARLQGVSVESPKLPKKVERIQGDLRFASTEAFVRGFQLAAGKSSLALDATVTRPLALLAKAGQVAPAGIQFAMRSPYLDLDELMPQGSGDPILPNAAGGGTVAIARLRGRKLDVAGVSARVGLRPTVLDVESYEAKGYGGTVVGSARFDLANPAAPVFAVKANLASLDANQLLTQWTPARDWLHGALQGNIDLGGQGSTADHIKRTLNANGQAAVMNGAIGPGPALRAVSQATGIPAFETIRFRDLKLPFRVESGRMITDPVLIEGPHGRWQLVGGIGFDGTLDYAVSVTLPPSAASLVQSRSNTVARALADTSGNLLLDLRVSGSVKAPRVTWDARATQDRLVGRLSRALLDQREKIEGQLEAEAERRRQAVTDSARAAVRDVRRAAEDSLRRRARDVLDGFFRGDTKTPPATPPPATSPPAEPTKAPAETVAASPDTAAKP